MFDTAIARAATNVTLYVHAGVVSIYVLDDVSIRCTREWPHPCLSIAASSMLTTAILLSA